MKKSLSPQLNNKNTPIKPCNELLGLLMLVLIFNPFAFRRKFFQGQ